MPMMEGTTRLKTWTGDYSFAIDGGLVSSITLRSNDGEIPIGSIVTGGVVEVTTALDSGGSATVAVTVESANDLITAAAFGGAPWSTTGRKSIIPAGTGATSIKTTASRAPKIVVAVAALTAGVVKVHLFYK